MPAVIPIVAAVAGAAITANASKSSANTQAQAAQSAQDATNAQYQQTRADQAPWRQAGGQAVDALSQWYGLPGQDGQQQTPDYQSMLQNMPGYQFQTDQGNQAVQRNLAARGLLQSGAAGKALTQYGQGQAASYADKYVNGLQSLAGLGQTSTQATSQAGQAATSANNSAMAYGANAQAAGTTNSANAWSNGLSGLAGIYGNYQQQQQNQIQPISSLQSNDNYQLQPYTRTSQYYGMN